MHMHLNFVIKRALRFITLATNSGAKLFKP